MSSADFEAKLSVLTSGEMVQAKNDPERLALMFERLLNSAAFTIAMMGKGENKAMNELLTGAESYLVEATASHAKSARLMTMIFDSSRPGDSR